MSVKEKTKIMKSSDRRSEEERVEKKIRGEVEKMPTWVLESVSIGENDVLWN